MQVLKKFNNNVVLAQEENGQELIVVGKGVGFPKVPYELNDTSCVEKFFVNMVAPELKTLFSQLPENDILLAKEIIEYGKKVSTKGLSDVILLTLSDHLHQAIERYNNGVELKSPLKWGLRHMYAEEVEIGRQAVKIIYQRRGVLLPELESVFIAMHFINAQIDKKKDTVSVDKSDNIVKVVDEILAVIKDYYKVDFDEESMNFTRFITHLQYFVLRQMKGTPLTDENQLMYDIVKKEYKNELICINRVENIIKKMYNWDCSNDERFYLALHIKRLLSQQTK